MSKRSIGEYFADEELISDTELSAECGISVSSLDQRVSRGDLPRPVLYRPKRWLRGEVDRHWPQVALEDEEVEDVLRELPQPPVQDVRGRLTAGGPAPQQDAVSPAEQARMGVSRLGRALADQAARLVAVPPANTPTGADEEHLADAVRRMAHLAEDVQNMVVAYLAAQDWDHEQTAEALGQNAKKIQQRLAASRRTPTGPPMDQRELDHWFVRYALALPDPALPHADPPSKGLRRIELHDELRRLNMRAVALEADPRSSAEERHRVHTRRTHLYGKLIKAVGWDGNPSLRRRLLAEARAARDAAKHAASDLRHVRPEED